MKKKTMVAASVLLVAALAFTGTALSIGGGMGMGMQGFGGMEKLLDNPKFIEELGLTDQQIDKIKKIKTDTMKTAIREGAEIKVLQIELADLIDTDKPDVKKIDAKIDEMGR